MFINCEIQNFYGNVQCTYLETKERKLVDINEITLSSKHALA